MHRPAFTRTQWGTHARCGGTRALKNRLPWHWTARRRSRASRGSLTCLRSRRGRFGGRRFVHGTRPGLGNNHAGPRPGGWLSCRRGSGPGRGRCHRGRRLCWRPRNVRGGNLRCRAGGFRRNRRSLSSMRRRRWRRHHRTNGRGRWRNRLSRRARRGRTSGHWGLGRRRRNYSGWRRRNGRLLRHDYASGFCRRCHRRLAFRSWRMRNCRTRRGNGCR
jgi:hypothetical protein